MILLLSLIAWFLIGSLPWVWFMLQDDITGEQIIPAIIGVISCGVLGPIGFLIILCMYNKDKVIIKKKFGK